MRSVLRHLDVAAINAAARVEARARQHHLPPITTYRWWARRTESVTGALIDAANQDRPGRLLVADPFTGGGVIALAALLRGHRVYAQDINEWAARSLATMLSLPPAADLNAAAERLHERVSTLLDDAYGTVFGDGTPATVAHTLRVAAVDCPSCGGEIRLYPTGLVSLTERVDAGGTAGWVACPAGHIQRGRADRCTRCRTCSRLIDPNTRYTTGRRFTCAVCGHQAKIASALPLRWIPVLVERTAAGRREIDQPSPEELTAAADHTWPDQPVLPTITIGDETAVLVRHGMTRWDHLYPRRQQAVLHALLSAADDAAEGDTRVAAALHAALVGSVEMAGYLSRWDARYLKAYEAVANHRYNFTTLAAEPNVWGAPQSGRGTVNRRIEHLAKAGAWYEERLGRALVVEGPTNAGARRSPGRSMVDARVVCGSSVRLLASTGSLDLVCTDPPYHDDVMYGELSELFRAWAGMGSARVDGEAVVSGATDTTSYEQTLTEAFAEMHRALKPDGHLVLSYANRDPAAWCALFGALQAAGFRAVGYAVLQSENDVDHAKAGRRACNLDVILDLVRQSDQPLEQHRPPAIGSTDEELFCHAVGKEALRIGSLEGEWRAELAAKLSRQPFLQPAAQQAVADD